MSVELTRLPRTLYIEDYSFCDMATITKCYLNKLSKKPFAHTFWYFGYIFKLHISQKQKIILQDVRFDHLTHSLQFFFFIRL